MPLNGAGAWTPATPEYPAISGTDILASDFNTILEDIAVALSTALYADGQAVATANIDMDSHKLVNLTTGTNPADATNVLQVFTSPTFADTTLAGTTTTVTGTTLDVNTTNCDLTGSIVTMATQAANDNSTKGATTAFVEAESVVIDGLLALKAPLASPTLTGVPAAPTAAPGTNTTQIATTAFVDATAFSSALPSQAGQGGYDLVATNGTTASWSDNPIHLLLVQANIL